MGAIENVILRRDRRGMARIAGFDPVDACTEAARLFLKSHRRVLILTGFYVGGAIETDGPLGAVAIARAAIELGGQATIVSDCYGCPVLRHIVPLGVPIEEFPITGIMASKAAAIDLAARCQPTLVVSVERCGATALDRYLNMRGLDISDHTARLDGLLALAPSIAIGDGGNEIGMGIIADRLSSELGIVEPCLTRADHLILCAVSNWGAYGLLAAVSTLAATPLLPSAASEEGLLERLVRAGAVDGITGASSLTVDGFDVATQSAVLNELGNAIRPGGVSPP
jgi:Domain of unknown function (DUF4392)